MADEGHARPLFERVREALEEARAYHIEETHDALLRMIEEDMQTKDFEKPIVILSPPIIFNVSEELGAFQERLVREHGFPEGTIVYAVIRTHVFEYSGEEAYQLLKVVIDWPA